MFQQVQDTTSKIMQNSPLLISISWKLCGKKHKSQQSFVQNPKKRFQI